MVRDITLEISDIFDHIQFHKSLSRIKSIQRKLNSAQEPSRGLSALPREKLGCVLQVVKWGTPGVLHDGVVRKRKTCPQTIVLHSVGKDAKFLAH